MGTPFIRRVRRLLVILVQSTALNWGRRLSGGGVYFGLTCWVYKQAGFGAKIAIFFFKKRTMLLYIWVFDVFTFWIIPRKSEFSFQFLNFFKLFGTRFEWGVVCLLGNCFSFSSSLFFKDLKDLLAWLFYEVVCVACLTLSWFVYTA